MSNKYRNDFAKQIDPVTGALMVTDFSHHEIHEGHHFFVENGYVLNTDGVRETLVVAPDSDVRIHLKGIIQASLAGSVVLYENTLKTGGTAFTPINRDRNSANVSALTVALSPTGSGDGTPILSGYWGSVGGTPVGGSVGGEWRNDSEIILKQGTAYLFRVTSLADANRITAGLDWYEHTPVDDEYFVKPLPKGND